jgi:hypothetical protein
MTVRQLIACLQRVPEEFQDREVVTEGCDCLGETDGIDLPKSYQEEVMICRTGQCDIHPEGKS